MSTENLKDASTYDVSQMRHLSDLEHVRERTGMYIGNRDVRGLHHLVTEVVDNSIDEVMAGYAKLIQVTINPDGSVTVADDGRGIPVDHDPSIGKSALEGVMTMLKYGGKFGGTAYKTSGGLHGMGVKAVNFLSEWCEVEVRRGGYVYQQEYERGKPTGPVRKIGVAQGTGTKTTFKPDYQVFGDLKFDYNILYRRLQELAFLNRGVKIVLQDLRTGEGETFQYANGLIEFVQYLNRATEPVHPDVIYIHHRDEESGVEVEVAFQYCSEYTENVHCYANNINTIDGGTHLTGFRSALTRTLQSYGKKENIFKDLVPTGEDLREGLTAVISVRLPNPQFEAQTKSKLNNPEIEGMVQSVVGEYLSQYLEEHPKIARQIVAKAMLAAEAREAARKAKALLRERKGALSGGSLPGKLRDCTSREVDKCELYLVEGDSAGGSAEGGRIREFQAILPLRGKIINAYKSREDKVLANEEIRSIISAVGSGIGEEFDLQKRRYGKIIIMTDADVDGSHIRTLLLTFFYRQMYDLVKAGYVYVAQPPLFRVRRKKEVYYVQTEEEMKAQLLEAGLADAIFEPGDGRTIAGKEMEHLCRTLAALEESLIALERRGISLRDHAARRDPETGRLPVYHVFIDGKEYWFTTRAQLEDFLAQEEIETGEELEVADEQQTEESPPQTDQSHCSESPDKKRGEVHIVELHEVRSINNQLAELRAMGFDIDALIPQERTGLEEPRYKLRRGDAVVGLDDLRGLLAAVRAAGEKGLQITRFKGLGEMNAEELRQTTLDPANRTLLKVTLEDAGEADTLFRVLMGDKVEPRREFI
ncbi:MAG TPA: DNA gyrase subunit B, partial [Thermoguttaceae bacterium]|nr:DNA gyrase subunit B [Thermoguttaceae bacterium]